MKPIHLMVVLLAILVLSSGLLAAQPADPVVADPDPTLPKEFAFTLSNALRGVRRLSERPSRV